MSYDDWLSQFHDVSLVYLVNTKFFSLAKRWHCYDFNGEWKGTSAGGCVNYPDTFLNNPQVRTCTYIVTWYINCSTVYRIVLYKYICVCILLHTYVCIVIK